MADEEEAATSLAAVAAAAGSVTRPGEPVEERRRADSQCARGAGYKRQRVSESDDYVLRDPSASVNWTGSSEQAQEPQRQHHQHQHQPQHQHQHQHPHPHQQQHHQQQLQQHLQHLHNQRQQHAAAGAYSKENSPATRSPSTVDGESKQPSPFAGNGLNLSQLADLAQHVLEQEERAAAAAAAAATAGKRGRRKGDGLPARSRYSSAPGVMEGFEYRRGSSGGYSSSSSSSGSGSGGGGGSGKGRGGGGGGGGSSSSSGGCLVSPAAGPVSGTPSSYGAAQFRASAPTSVPRRQHNSHSLGMPDDAAAAAFAALHGGAGRRGSASARELKTLHAVMEQKRRDDIRIAFDALKNVLPLPVNCVRSKVEILREACEHIRMLIARDRELERERSLLCSDIQSQSRQLQELVSSSSSSAASSSACGGSQRSMSPTASTTSNLSPASAATPSATPAPPASSGGGSGATVGSAGSAGGVVVAMPVAGAPLETVVEAGSSPAAADDNDDDDEDDAVGPSPPSRVAALKQAAAVITAAGRGCAAAAATN